MPFVLRPSRNTTLGLEESVTQFHEFENVRQAAGGWVAAEHRGHTERCSEIEGEWGAHPEWPQSLLAAINQLEHLRHSTKAASLPEVAAALQSLSQRVMDLEATVRRLEFPCQ